MFEKKQNVFDDWFAAAEYLIANKYTSPEHFAIHRPVERRPADGRLHHPAAGAVLGRLVRLSAAGHAALPEVLVGSYWTTEYGSADNEKQFPTC
jgi:prolyl oligopeptidase